MNLPQRIVYLTNGMTRFEGPGGFTELFVGYEKTQLIASALGIPLDSEV